MKILGAWAIALFLAATLLVPVQAQEKERDIFNYAAQKRAGKDVKKIVTDIGFVPVQGATQ